MELGDFSRAVRESSLKRFRAVPHEHADWCCHPGAFSFTALAGHLIAADRWLFAKLADPQWPPMAGETGPPAPFPQLLRDLEATGRERAALLSELSPEELGRRIPDARFGGPVSIWWVIVRGNLDHEIHHRGQLTVYLAMLRNELQG